MLDTYTVSLYLKDMDECAFTELFEQVFPQNLDKCQSPAFAALADGTTIRETIFDPVDNQWLHKLQEIGKLALCPEFYATRSCHSPGITFGIYARIGGEFSFVPTNARFQPTIEITDQGSVDAQCLGDALGVIQKRGQFFQGGVLHSLDWRDTI